MTVFSHSQGCDGNSNNFDTQSACVDYCAVSGKSRERRKRDDDDGMAGCPNGGEMHTVDGEAVKCTKDGQCPGGHVCTHLVTSFTLQLCIKTTKRKHDFSFKSPFFFRCYLVNLKTISSVVHHEFQSAINQSIRDSPVLNQRGGQGTFYYKEKINPHFIDTRSKIIGEQRNIHIPEFYGIMHTKL